MASAMPFSYRQPPLATINPKPKLLLPCAPMPVISARCAAAISIGEGRSTLSQLIWFVKMSGTSFRRRRLEGSGRFLWERSVRNPGMRSTLRRGICYESPSLTETFRLARRNFPARNFFLLFLRFPQGILVLHSLCTTPHEISVADVLCFKQSTASADVRCLESAVRLQQSWRFRWFSRVNCRRVSQNAPGNTPNGAF